MVKTWAGHKTTETVLNYDWRVVVGGSWRLAVGGGWRRMAVGSSWLVAVGGWRLAAVGCPPGLSLTKRQLGFLRTALRSKRGRSLDTP